MKVFISWSGERSQAVAELLSDWLKLVLQAAKPWISSQDIDRGALWFSAISDTLNNTEMGIICLTKDNKNAPWILFEAGALSKGLTSSRVCTFLIDLEPTDVSNPLAQFNATKPIKDDVYKLVRTLNSYLSESLDTETLGQVFNTYWPQFESRLLKILKTKKSKTKEAPRSEESLLTEILRTVRTLDHRLLTVEKDKFEAKRLRQLGMLRPIEDEQLDPVSKALQDTVLVKRPLQTPQEILDMLRRKAEKIEQNERNEMKIPESLRAPKSNSLDGKD